MLPGEKCTWSSLQKPAEIKSKVGRLLRSMYGCRDAGVYRHSKKQLRVFARRRLLGYSSMSSVFFFLAKLQEVWVVTNRGILGTPGYHDCVQSITCEADPRDAELIRKSYGVTGRSKERSRSARKQQIGIAPTPRVHSISRYRSSAGIWHARFNNH